MPARSASFKRRQPPLPKFQAALARVKAGTGRARVATALSDSLTAGFMTGGFLDTRTKTWVVKLAALFSAIGYPGVTEGVFGTGGENIDTPAAFTAYDPTVTFADASWTLANGNLPIPGGHAFRCISGTGNMTKTPAIAVDTFIIRACRSPSQGSYNWNIDGGANTAVTSISGANGVDVQTITTTLGMHVLNIARKTGTVNIYSIEAYDSTASAIDWCNCGWGSSTTSMWVGNAAGYDTRPAYRKLAPDLTIIPPGPNDWSSYDYDTFFDANVLAYINDGKITGDVVIFTPYPQDTSHASVSRQRRYVNALKNAAFNNNLRLVDMWGMLGGNNDNPVARGIDIGGAHMTEAGHTLFANEAFRVLTAP